MSRIESPVKDINDLMFLPFPNTPKEGMKVVRSYDTIVAIDKNGIIYTNRVLERTVYSFPNEPKMFLEVMTCLKKLKAVSPSLIDQHCKLREAQRKSNATSSAKRLLAEYARTAGIELTEEQKKQLK